MKRKNKIGKIMKREDIIGIIPMHKYTFDELNELDDWSLELKWRAIDYMYRDYIKRR